MALGLNSKTKMATKCRACNKIVGEQKMRCSLADCEKDYDLLCLGIQQKDYDLFTADYKRQWVCPECVGTKRKRIDGNTPVRRPEHNKISPNSDSNVNKQRGSRKKQPEACSVDINFEENVMTFLKEMRMELRDRLDSQERSMKYIKELCYSTRHDMEEFKTKFDMFSEQQSTVSTSLHNDLRLLHDRNQSIELLVTKIEESVNINKKSATLSNEHNMSQLLATGDIVGNSARITFNKSVEQHCRATESSNITDTSQSDNKTTQNIEQLNIPSSPELSQKWDDSVNECHTSAKHCSKISNQGEIRKEMGNAPCYGTILDQQMTASANKTNGLIRVQKIKAKEVSRGGNTQLSEIKAQERNKYLHVWRLTSDTTVEKLTSYMQKICGSEIDVQIRKLEHKTPRNYSSFVITVPEKTYELICKPEVWPVNTEFAEWIWFRRPTKKLIDKV
ncbi:hypothetical protein ACJJTC_005359 [Scirpophaga incertulas]